MLVTVMPVVDEALDFKEPIGRTGCPGNNKCPLDDSTADNSCNSKDTFFLAIASRNLMGT